MSVLTTIGLKLCGFYIEHGHSNGRIFKYIDVHSDNRLHVLLQFIGENSDIEVVETHDGKSYYRAYL